MSLSDFKVSTLAPGFAILASCDYYYDDGGGDDDYYYYYKY